MKVAATSLSALALSAAMHCLASGADRPNIILFMVDDMGWQDTSVPFADSVSAYNRVYHTPNMQRLADTGMKFTSAYASPISSPSRCSLITGANAARHRVTNWTLNRDESTDEQSDTFQLPDWNYNGVCRVAGVNNTYRGASFVDALRHAGYHTIHCGKAHFGAFDTPGENPAHWGFETNIAGSAIGGLATYLSEFNYGHDDNGQPTSRFAVEGLRDYWKSGTFITEALTREAVKALDKALRYNQPWFLYMAHYAVHIPIDRDMRFYQRYIDSGLSPKEAAYASLIEGMDKSLGDLLDWLEEHDQTDNTIVIFMSDNGGLASQPAWRDGAPFTQNAPLRSGKGSLLEGGIREPMIVRWPGRTKPGSVCSDYVIIEDFYPSIIEMAGAEMRPDGTTIDGVSFVPLIDGTANPAADRALIWNMPNIWGNNGPGINLACAIRKNNWKMIYHYDTDQHELYDLSKDIGENVDLSRQYPEIVRALAAELGSQLRRMEAQRPARKATGEPCPWPDE